MSSVLYPIRFNTIFKDKIWGGSKIKSILGKEFAPLPNCGETWELSAVTGNVSVIANGPLAGTDLQSLLKEEKEKLVGRKVYAEYGNEFPLLIKFIDANDDLSIQVHPDDVMAKERHGCAGKTEMWYILGADKDSVLNTGFNRPLTKEEYLSHLNGGTLSSILNFEKVDAGDVFFLPSGRVHYIGKGILLAEIQQTSDMTYRIYDFDRTDAQGNKRELHTELALDAIDFTHHKEYKTLYEAEENSPVNLVHCPYFTTDLLELTTEVELDYTDADTFRIFMVVEGRVTLSAGDSTEFLGFGDVILIPASVKHLTLTPADKVKLLEVYIS